MNRSSWNPPVSLRTGCPILDSRSETRRVGYRASYHEPGCPIFARSLIAR